MARARIRLDIRSERKKVVRKTAIIKLAVKGKIEQFRIALKNYYSALTEEDNMGFQAMEDNLTRNITKFTIHGGRKIAREDTGSSPRRKKI